MILRGRFVFPRAPPTASPFALHRTARILSIMADGRIIDDRDDERGAPPAPGGPETPQHIADRVEELNSADAAAIMEDLSSERAADVAEILDPHTTAGILKQMHADHAARIVAEMPAPEAAVVLEAMQPDDRVDLLEHIPQEKHDRLMEAMDAPEAAEVRRLEQYPPDSAGGIMTTEVTALPEHLTVGQAVEELRRLNEQLEQLFYVYVVDAGRRLVGVLSMRDLILARPDKTLNRIMRTGVHAVPATMDQEEVARQMRRRNFLALPVVDQQNRLVGLITVDDVVDVMEEEATEDVQKMAGAGPEERLTSPWHFSFRKRVLWLQVNLATAFLAASVVGLFEHTIEKLVLLAAYMPIVAGMGGNASAQAMAVAIRGIALGEVDRKLLGRLLYRESIVGLLTGLVSGLVTAAIAMNLHADQAPQLGLVLALALVINHTVACVSGVGIPFIMKSLGFDPAQSATIFATTVTDIVGFFVLLGLAQIMLM